MLIAIFTVSFMRLGSFNFHSIHVGLRVKLMPPVIDN